MDFEDIGANDDIGMGLNLMADLDEKTLFDTTDNKEVPLTSFFILLLLFTYTQEDLAFKSRKDAVIFLVDCRTDILKESKGKGRSHLEVVLIECLQNFLKTKIITNENDRIGLIFYNTKKIKNKLNYKGISVVFTLDFPDAEKINYIAGIPEDFERDYGTSDTEIPLYSALMLANHELQEM